MGKIVDWFLGTLLVLLVTIAILAAVIRATERQRCNDRGGVYIDYQCVDLTTGRLM